MVNSNKGESGETFNLIEQPLTKALIDFFGKQPDEHDLDHIFFDGTDMGVKFDYFVANFDPDGNKVDINAYTPSVDLKEIAKLVMIKNAINDQGLGSAEYNTEYKHPDTTSIDFTARRGINETPESTRRWLETLKDVFSMDVKSLEYQKMNRIAQDVLVIHREHVKNLLNQVGEDITKK